MVARFPLIFRLYVWAMLLFLGAIPGLALLLLIGTGNFEAGKGLLLVLLSITGISVYAWSLIYMNTTEFAVTDQRVIGKWGVFTRRTNEIPLQALEYLNLRQGFWARIFDYGRLEILGSGGGATVTPPLQNPVQFRSAVSEARIALEQNPGYVPHPSARSFSIDEPNNHDGLR